MPFALLGVNSDRDLAKIRGIVETKDITWRSFWSGQQETGGHIPRAWGVRGWPTIYAFDEKGVVRFQNCRGAAMDAAVETLLDEM